MNCPLCTDQILQAHHRGGIEIDVCPHCHGIWLDRGELERLADDDPATAPAFATARSAERGDERSGKKGKKDKGSRKKRLGDRLGDLLEEALDL